jgi:hypothetical protein
MANILCNNVDIDFLQQYAFYVPKKDFNPFVDCSSTYNLDLSLWANQNATNQVCPTTTTSTTTTSTTTTSTTTTTTIFRECPAVNSSLISSASLQQLQSIFNVTQGLIYPSNTVIKQKLDDLNVLLDSYPSLTISYLQYAYTSDNYTVIENDIAQFSSLALYNLPSLYSTSTISDIFTGFNTPKENIVNFQDLNLSIFLFCLSVPETNALPVLVYTF